MVKDLAPIAFGGQVYPQLGEVKDRAPIDSGGHVSPQLGAVIACRPPCSELEINQCRVGRRFERVAKVRVAVRDLNRHGREVVQLDLWLALIMAEQGMA